MVPVVRGNTRCISSPGLHQLWEPLFLPAHKPPLHQHLLSPCNIFSQSIAPDLWSAFWKTLLCMGSAMSFHQITYCSVSLILQPQLSSRTVALKCFLQICTFLFSCTSQSFISTCSLLVSELQIYGTIAFWEFILSVQLLCSLLVHIHH